MSAEAVIGAVDRSLYTAHLHGAHGYTECGIPTKWQYDGRTWADDGLAVHGFVVEGFVYCPTCVGTP